MNFSNERALQSVRLTKSAFAARKATGVCGSALLRISKECENQPEGDFNERRTNNNYSSGSPTSRTGVCMTFVPHASATSPIPLFPYFVNLIRHAQGHDYNFMRAAEQLNEARRGQDYHLCMGFLTQARTQVLTKPLCRNLSFSFRFIDIFYGHHSLAL
jgi:hypothetical protein